MSLQHALKQRVTQMPLEGRSGPYQNACAGNSATMPVTMISVVVLRLLNTRS
jgi:hypothetical protein